MNNSWTITSLLASTVAGIIAYLLFSSWRFSLVCALIVFVVVVIYNPKFFFFRAFKILASLLIVFNKISYEIIGEFLDVEFNFKSIENSKTLTWVLALLMGLCLILLFLERNGKFKGTWIDINQNKSIVKGSGNYIKQEINKGNKKEE